MRSYILGWCLVALACSSCQGERGEGGGGGEPRWMGAISPLGFDAALTSFNVTDFESGNIGKIQWRSRTDIVLHLRSDNDDPLPPFWRQWWFMKLENVRPGRATTMTLRGRGHWNYYLPVYSYDGKTWRSFSRREVGQPSKFSLRIRKTFRRSTVWLARFEPYTYSKLRNYLHSLKAPSHLRKSSLGKSPLGHEIPVLSWGEVGKPQIYIHARTHPGEVGSSFFLEGMLNRLQGSSRAARYLRRNAQIHVVPMLNIDGVIAGNNRVNTEGINLEGKWTPHPQKPWRLLRLHRNVPREVRLWHRYIVKSLKRGGRPVMALNLHASNGEPRDQMFFFPHFGPKSRGYSAREAKLFREQSVFIDLISQHAGRGWTNAIPQDGGRFFLNQNVPEAWWWRNFGPEVMALSIEATYGQAGRNRRWMKPRDLRWLGGKVVSAMADYFRRRQTTLSFHSH